MKFTQRPWLAIASFGLISGYSSIIAAQSSSALSIDTALSGGKANLSTPLALNWRFTATPTSFNRTNATVVGKRVYFATGGRVYALNSESGAQAWKFPIDEPLPSAVTTTPIVQNGSIYFLSGDGKLFSLKADTGTLDWQFDTRNSSANALTIENGIAYFGTGNGKIWAIDTQTHDTVGAWKNGVQLSDEMTGPLVISKGMAFALTLDQQLHGISVATGKERWLVHLKGTVLKQEPVMAGDYIYVANGSNVTCVVPQNGSIKWGQFMPCDASAPLMAFADNLYMFGTDRTMYTLDLRTGRMKNAKPPKLNTDVLAKPVIEGSTMFVTGTSGLVYGLDLEKNAAINWSYRIMPSTSRMDTVPSYTNAASSPVIADGTMYVLTDDGSLSSFRSDAVDTTGPVISDTEPDPGLVVNGTPPFHFEAKVVDEGAGLNPDSVRIKIDGQLVPKRPDGPNNEDKPGSFFDAQYSIVEYDIMAPTSASVVRPLSDGEHTVTVVAADWKGNVTEKSWKLTIDNSISRRQVRKRDKNKANGAAGGAGKGMSGPGLGGSLGGGGGAGKGGN